MKNIKKIIVLTILVLGCNLSFAQQDPMESEYMFNQLFINPAYAGCHPYTDALLLYRKQWVDFPGAPVTEIFSMDGSLKNKNMGLGLVLVNDHLGVTTRTEFYGTYSYHLKLSKKQTLALGLSGGASYYQAALTDLLVWDPGDYVFASNIQNKLIPNFGSGAYFYSDNYYAGFSVPNILSYKPSTLLYIDLLNYPEFQRHYYLTGGYTFMGNSSISWKPSILLKYTDGTPPEADFNLNILMDKLVEVGVSYRTGDSFVGMLELYVVKNLCIGYAYDYPITVMRNSSAGSDEIKISYDFGRRKKPSMF